MFQNQKNETLVPGTDVSKVGIYDDYYETTSKTVHPVKTRVDR